MIPSDAAARKALPITTGVLDYFPDAILAVAHCSKVGNDQHNPGQPLHWDKSKSKDHADSLNRHMLQRGKLDTDFVRHSAKVAWRALAMLQCEIETEPNTLPEEEMLSELRRGDGTLGALCGRCGEIVTGDTFIAIIRQIKENHRHERRIR